MRVAPDLALLGEEGMPFFPAISTVPVTPLSTPNKASMSSFWPWPSSPPRPTIWPGPTFRSTPLRRFSHFRSATVSTGSAAFGSGLGGYCASTSRPIISRTISASERAPLAKVSMWRPLRNTDNVSHSASTSCMRWEMNRLATPWAFSSARRS